MAARAVIRFAALLVAATMIGAAPALAQTNDPNLTQTEIDCLNRATTAADCIEDDTKAASGERPGAGSAATNAVFLPALIVDLFPNPVGGGQAPLPTPDPRRDPAGGGLPPPVAPAGATAVQAAAAGGPIVSPSDLVAAEPPRAIVGDFVPDEVLVTVEGGAVQQIAASFGLEVRSQRQSQLLGSTLVRFGIPDGRPVGVVLAQLAADGRTLRREPNHIYSLQQVATVVNYAFDRIALDAKEASGENVRIAVVDTAIDDTNPALSGVIADQFDAMPDVPIEARDHGTSIDGLIAGVGALKGMAPGARIYHARAFEGGKSSMDVILAALDWAAEQDVRIINMSFVGPKNDLLGVACRNARALGIVLVAAAGNNGPKAPYGYPAAFDSVIAVTATDAKDGLMQQANRGAYVFLSAPGVEMVAPSGAGSDVVTGTSFAAAIVTGAIANLLHAAPDRSADWVEKALAATARDLGPKGRDNDFGHGLLDIKAAATAKE
ncbi:S8 family serine peptidase [Mesorhizobium sp.]|uniref:S8 family serine peptidase n=1 Tax=Mesorhizobium sp. TaxID=1871066 RepID=UPI000FE651F3|nr:S8 family serine peptidase [Mesorhizobium sp.]RWK43520.1 MAG: peptidase S8 [Mesorhizobium sp.]RWK66619.1 MAG: peptidase S8 [Mesorhizobium sp.]RWK77418.1 MAG: peptidase S8 [Mesorhizobium sp.]RWK79454.1 MAG: peptidase S8 [Mesorhizobium sp.]RWL02066.1 MAG: peptidase S8 [Mesorhizobium sp.]